MSPGAPLKDNLRHEVVVLALVIHIAKLSVERRRFHFERLIYIR
jgi:hypothetical protein